MRKHQKLASQDAKIVVSVQGNRKMLREVAKVVSIVRSPAPERAASVWLNVETTGQ